VTRPIPFSEALNSDLHGRILRPEEIEKLSASFAFATAFYAAVDITEEYFSHWRKLVIEENERRGEVALVVRNQAKDILLHTKYFYPKGVFRIPTGGIQFDEGVVDSMLRELREETSFHALSFQFRSLLLYEFKNGAQSLPFASYIFEIEPDGEAPLVSDPGEQISDFKWAPLSGISEVIDGLHSLCGSPWQDWGKVRVIPHEILFQNAHHWQQDGVNRNNG